jgi:radical SAM protein with 4Fe4S-binding SPASM domain
LVVWEVTQACALACRHCRAEARPARHPEELDFEEALDVVDQVVRIRPDLLILTGGDPMCRPDLVSILRHATGKGLQVALSPSATPRLLKADFEQLRQSGLVRMSLSLDAPDEESHDQFRGIPRAWEWTMEAFRRARAAGIGVQINTTLWKENIGRLDEFAELLTGLGPSVWSLFALVPMGRGRRSDLPTAEDMERCFHHAYELSQRLPFPMKTTEGHHYRRICLQREGQDRISAGSPWMGMGDGRGFVFISHRGAIMPSGFLPLSAGNVRTDELGDVYARHPVFQRLRDPNLLRGKCGRCQFRKICGGSRARAYAMTGDYLAADGLCSHLPSKTQEPVL